MTPRPAALYLRVSTQQQAGLERFGLEAQRADAERYARAAGLKITDTYQDVITGTRASREALDQLLDNAVRHEVVLVSAVDRLARRTAVAYAVLDELMEAGFELHSADMGQIDPKDDMSALNFGVRSVFSDAEHRRITKRLRGGMLAKVRSGKPVVPPNAYGWVRGEINEAEAQWVREAYRLCREGQPATKITQHLNRHGVPARSGNPWTHSVVLYMLKNPLYKGVYTFGKARKGRGDGRDLVTCEVEAIVPPEEWEAAQRALINRRTGGRPSEHHTLDALPLAKRLTCGQCGGTLTAVTNPPVAYRSAKSPYHYYHCYNIFARNGQEQPKCSHRRYYGAKKLHPFILDGLRGLLTDDAALTAALHRAPVAPLNTQPAMDAIDKRLRNLKLLALDGAIPPAEYRETRQELEAQKAALQQAGTTLQLSPAPDLTRARTLLAAALAQPDLLSVVRALDLHATVYPEGRVDLRLDGI